MALSTYEQSQGQQGKWADQSPSVPQVHTPFHAVNEARVAIGELEIHLNTVVASLVGERSQDASKQAARVAKAGHLGALEGMADEIRDAVARMHDALNAIERQMP